MSKAETLRNFESDGTNAFGGGIFGLPFSTEESEVIVLPVPWEVTASYGAGTSKGPEAILAASAQLDLYDEVYPGSWKMGIAMAPVVAHWQQESDRLRALAVPYIRYLEKGGKVEAPEWGNVLAEINAGCDRLMQEVEAEAEKWLAQGKAVALVGGDHSTPLGFMRALAKRNPEMGILQIDAHADLRVAYEGFEYSHASIMHNALQLDAVSRLTQVGIRDYCEAEALRMEQDDRIAVFTGRSLNTLAFEGAETWAQTCDRIVKTLPQSVYISFDIDGLSPDFCPNTGTPVPGGLSFEAALFLIQKIGESGRKIIGLDLCEVAPGTGENEWDANVGARILYRLCIAMGVSQNRF